MYEQCECVNSVKWKDQCKLEKSKKAKWSFYGNDGTCGNVWSCFYLQMFDKFIYNIKSS